MCRATPAREYRAVAILSRCSHGRRAAGDGGAVINESVMPIAAQPAVHTGPPVTSPTRYRMLLETMRPKQWTKNAFVLAGVVFSGQALEFDAQWRAWTTFVAF